MGERENNPLGRGTIKKDEGTTKQGRTPKGEGDTSVVKNPNLKQCGQTLV